MSAYKNSEPKDFRLNPKKTLTRYEPLYLINDIIVIKKTTTKFIDIIGVETINVKNNEGQDEQMVFLVDKTKKNIIEEIKTYNIWSSYNFVKKCVYRLKYAIKKKALDDIKKHKKEAF